MANVSQLQPALTPQVQTSSSEAPEKDADFLALRLVNKRARVRLSPEPLDLSSFPGKASLFAIVNSRGWFAAVTRDAGGASALVFSPLMDLRTALAAASADDEQSFKPQRRVPINGALPHILTFACNDTRLLLGLVDGLIHVYASDQLLSRGEGPVQPIHMFTTSSSVALLSIHPNPGDIPELVAVLRDCTDSPGSLAVELLDVQKFTSSGGWMAGKSPSTTPTSISWSPKGKQLALGLQSGDIVTFSPSATATPKSCIPHPPSTNSMSVVSMHWLSTTSFHTIYVPSGKLTPDVEQIHFHSSMDSKNHSAQDIRFNNPYLPFPGLRPPGDFLVCLRDWDPSKVLLFIGDSTSSDIGLIGSVVDDSGESWRNLSLEETSTPSLPLDKDQNDTILLGMDLDLTGRESYHHSTASGEALELPAHPIMYVYASDGTIIGWHVLNVTGKPYPGMVMGVNASVSAANGPSRLEREPSDMQMTPSISPTASSLMETSVPKPPSAVFGQPSSFGLQGSPFGASGPGFGQLTAFGQTAPGANQQPTPVFSKPPSTGPSVPTSVFGSTAAPSPFGQSSASPFGSTVSGGGFGAFASVAPAKFGQTGFGFGGPSQTTTSIPPPPSTSVPEESMASDDSPSLGGFGLGSANPQDADSRPSIFGNTTVPASSAPESTSGLIKTGFGAFGGFDQKSPFAKPSAFTSGFSNTTSGPSTGAFSNFQSTPASFVKPASGLFGELPKESPFFAPAKSAESKPVSAFALSSTPTSLPPKPSSTQPTFGSSSMPGGGIKSAFAPVSATPAQPPPASAGAFNAFTGGSGGFATLSSAGTKSFSDLLRTGGEANSSSSEETPTKPAQAPISTTPVSAFPPKPFTSTDGGFASFASGGNKSFGDILRASGDNKPAPAQSDETPTKPPPPAPVSTTPVSRPATEPPKLFTTSGGGFTAFSAGGNKSFGDLLSTAGGDKTPASAPSEETPGKSVLVPQVPVFVPKPATEPAKLFGSSGGGGFAAFAAGGDKPFGTTGEDKSPPRASSEETPKKPTLVPPQPSAPVFRPASEPPKLSGTNGGGFAAFAAGGSKPFGDLLRTTGGDKPPAPAPSEATPGKPAQPPPQPPVSVAPISAAAQEPPKLFPGGGFAAFSLGGSKPFGDVPPRSTPPGSRAEPSEGASAKPAQPLPSPPASATSVSTPAKEPVKPPTPPVVVKIEQEEPEIVEVKVSQGAVRTAEEAEEEEDKDEEGEEGSASGVPSESDAFEEDEGVEGVEEEGVEEEEVEKPVEEVKPPLPAPAPVQAPPPIPSPTPEQGMQVECRVLCMAIERELELLKQSAMKAAIRFAQFRKTSGIAHQKADLADNRKWTLGDIEEYRRLLLDVQVDVRGLKGQPASLRKFLKELNSNMLKVNTRKEEIVRFNKAKMDAEFAKMLKIRTLAPENAETQSQLRKSIRTIKDRVQKLEDHLQASKKRINELRTGRPSLRPPSLDTVNRTFRNIDVTIEQQKQEIYQLRRRIAGLDIAGGTAREHLAASSPKRPLNVTPNVAMTTAAALNAERSAQRFKKALLASRTRPLLNTSAVAKVPAVEAPKYVFALPAPPATPAMSFPSSLPAWMPPPSSEFGSLAMHDLPLSRGRAGTKHHQKPIALKKNGSPAAPTTQPSSLFEWKPVEPVRPAFTLPFAIRPAGSS